MIRLFLNLAHRDAYSLFDEKTGVRFNISDPYKTVPYISEPLRRSIVAGKIIDIDNISGIKLDPKTIDIQNRVLASVGIARNSKNKEEIETVESDREIVDVNKETEESDKEAKPKNKRNASKGKEEGEK